MYDELDENGWELLNEEEEDDEEKRGTPDDEDDALTIVAEMEEREEAFVRNEEEDGPEDNSCLEREVTVNAEDKLELRAAPVGTREASV